MVAHGKEPASRKLNAREEVFARLLVAGDTQAVAWRKAYKKPVAKDQTAAEKGSRLAARPCVQARVAELRAKTDAGVLLSVNDRLHILSSIARDAKGKAVDKTRAIDVYTKIAGGGAPLQIAVSGKDGGPIEVAATVSVTRAPVRARLAALRAAREARG